MSFFAIAIKNNNKEELITLPRATITEDISTKNEEESNIFDVIVGGAIFLGIATVGGVKLLKK